MTTKRHLTRGFTIIELVVVIAIVGVLATITLFVYNGIQQSAKQATLISDLDNATTSLEYDLKATGSYPATIALADNGNGLPIKSGTTYQYTVNTSTTSPSFCLTGTNGTSSYKISSVTISPSAGGCPGHGQGGVVAVTNNAKNPYIKSGVTGGWTGYNPLGGQTFSVSPSSNGSRGAWRLTSGAPGIGSGTTTGYEYQGTGISVTAGSTVYPSIYVQVSQSGTYTVNCQFFNGITQTGNCPTSNTGISANTWTRLSDGAVTVPAATDRMNIRAQYVSGSTLVAGDWIDVTMVSTAQGGYADGDSQDWIWNGTANSSTSTGPSL